MEGKIFKIRISDEFQLVDEKLIRDFVKRNEILKIDTQLVKDEINYWSVLIFYNEIENYIETPDFIDTIENRKWIIKQYHKYNPKDNIVVSENLNIIQQPSELELMIYRKLKEWREEKTENSNLPPYVILKNSQLMSIARHLPNNLEDLENVNEIAKAEIEQFGEEILVMLQSILTENLQ